MNQPPDEKPKIIIDEDWKSQVEREKQQLHEQAARQQAPAADQPPPSSPPHPDYPPATLSLLVSTLATQAVVALGHMADPATGRPAPDLPQAHHLIDLLQVLQDKTAGNRTPQESALLEQLLHELRLAYVDASSHAPPSPT